MAASSRIAVKMEPLEGIEPSQIGVETQSPGSPLAATSWPPLRPVNLKVLAIQPCRM